MNGPSGGRVRVLHLVYQLACGGMENGVVNLANHMDPGRFRVGICAFVGGGAYEKRLDPARTPLFAMGKREGNDPLLPFRLARLLRRWRPHVLHTHAWGTLVEGVVAGKLARVPVIVHGEHGTMETRRRNVWVQRVVWRWTDRVLSVSEMHKQRLIRTIGPGPGITVVPNGVDTERFHPPRDRAEERRALGWDPDEVCLIAVGRLVPVKDHALLIWAFARATRGMKERARLYVAGDGPLKNELERLARDLGMADRVVLLGRRDDVPVLLRASDVFVLPSKSEGMSNTLLEAMSTGLCCVATDVGGNPELVRHEENGLLVPAGEEAALAASLARLVRDRTLRERLGRAARRFVERHHSLETMVKGYGRLYLELLSCRVRGALQAGPGPVEEMR